MALVHRSLALALAVPLLVFAGCASHSTVTNRPVATEEVQDLLSKSPHVKALSSKSFARRTEPADIQLFNYSFNFLDKPDLLKNWEYHYVIGPASQPAWRAERVAEILVYLRNRNDADALAKMKASAAAMGSDAIIDLHRKPIITKRPPSPIDAYMYFGVAVRKVD